MRFALVRKLAVNLLTANALLDRQLISHFRTRPGRLARYDLTLTEYGLSQRRWFMSLGYK
jgi:hypothetical protein